MKPEMLKINPWHQMPNMSDGALNLAESGAIIRYIANKYAPSTYGAGNLLGGQRYGEVSVLMSEDRQSRLCPPPVFVTQI